MWTRCRPIAKSSISARRCAKPSARTIRPSPTRPPTRAAFHVETDADVHADHWEIHPGSEEAVCCLSGALRLYLRPDHPGDAETEVRLSAGTAFVVPRNRWHRLELDRPSDIMSIGLRDGTRIEPVAGP
ncbi:cupin domain-containing protein [Nocardia fusca]|uniref:cupin domain-containing protein n=1 Tax=Nocardia fusca TaxID=941183 RepID=UPI000A048A64